MEPIPLRTLIVLLNYERMISNPLFEGVRLLQSTLTEPTLIWDLTGHARAIMYTPGAPTSIKYATPHNEKCFRTLLIDHTFRQTNVHIFERYIEPKTSDTPSTTCAIHPAARPETKALTPSQRELVYHETRGHSSCFKAIGLFNTFFKLCPPGQKLSIQIRNEVRTGPWTNNYHLLGSATNQTDCLHIDLSVYSKQKMLTSQFHRSQS
jgi:hypothetical protein